MAKPKKRTARTKRGPLAKSTVTRRRPSAKRARVATLANPGGKRSRIAKAGASRRRKQPGAIARKRGAGRSQNRRAVVRKPRQKKRVVMKWRKPRKRNSAQGAQAMYEKFHGRPSAKTIDYRTAQHHHAHLAELGKLSYLKVLMPEGSKPEAVELRPKGVVAACSEDGGQIYFLGGDQALNLNKLGLADQLPKDHVVIGPVFEIEYVTEKKFDGFERLNYYHQFGEEGGELPTLLYDVRSKLMYLAGGSYQCLAPGITD